MAATVMSEVGALTHKHVNTVYMASVSRCLIICSSSFNIILKKK